MHNLAENLRHVWEDPDSEEVKKILEKGSIEVNLYTDKKDESGKSNIPLPNFILHLDKVDLKKILRDRIAQGVENFFIAMREAFINAAESEDVNISKIEDIPEISIFLAGNSSKSKLVKEIFAEYFGQEKISEDSVEDDGNVTVEGAEIDSDEDLVIKNVPQEQAVIKSKAAEILGISQNAMPQFNIFPALGTDEAIEIQKKRGVEINPNDIAAPTGKTGVAFGLLKCRDSGNVKIMHITPTANQTPFQFYVGRNKKRKFKTVINKNTKFGVWYEFIDAGNNFDILYSDLPEAISDKMDVQKAKRKNVMLDKFDSESTVFIRAVKSNVIEDAIAKDAEELKDAKNLPEPVPIELD